MNRDENPLIALVKSAKNTSVTGLALTLTDALDGVMREAVESEMPKKKMEKLFQASREEIAKRLFQEIDERATEIRASFERDGKAYANDAVQHLNRSAQELELSRNRFGAMSDAELRAELENIATSEYTSDPNTIDALFVAAKSSGIPPTDVAPYREVLISKDYQSPWKQNPASRILQNELDMCAECRGYDFPLVGYDDSVTMLSIDDLLEEAE